MTTKELKRLKVLAWIEGEQVTVMQAAELLVVSERHCWRDQDGSALEPNRP